MVKKKKKEFKHPGPGRAIYPWGKWLTITGRVKTLTWGVDFNCRVDTMATQVRIAAYKRGLKMSIQTHSTHARNQGDRMIMINRNPSEQVYPPYPRYEFSTPESRKDLEPVKPWGYKLLRVLARWYLLAWILAWSGLLVHAIIVEMIWLSSMPGTAIATSLTTVLFIVAIIFSGD